MIEFKAKIKSLAKNVFNNKVELTLEFDGNPADFEELLEKELRVSLKQWRYKRTNNANSYFWALLDKLAETLGKRKTTLYKAYIKEIGGVSETVCVRDKAVKDLRKAWESKGLGWQTETMDSKIDGCTNVILYYGSSAYDTKQMSRLLDLVIQDCEAVGIPTLTRNEIDDMKRRWGYEEV